MGVAEATAEQAKSDGEADDKARTALASQRAAAAREVADKAQADVEAKATPAPDVD